MDNIEREFNKWNYEISQKYDLNADELEDDFSLEYDYLRLVQEVEDFYENLLKRFKEVENENEV